LFRPAIRDLIRRGQQRSKAVPIQNPEKKCNTLAWRRDGNGWLVMLGEEYVRGLWPKSRAVRFANSIVTTKLF
jgi:hypothetical protein